MKTMRAALLSITAAAAVLPGACSDTNEPTPVGDGRLIVRITDAGTLIDSVKSVDLFVVRIDGRLAAASDSEAASNVDEPAAGGWTTLATPNASFNLLALQGRVSSALGDVAIRAAAYEGVRIIVDPSKSSVTLNSGRVLTASSSPGIRFSSAKRTGINIALSRPVVVASGETTNLIVDFDIGATFVQSGGSIERNGLVFRPVISATIVDAGTNRARVRFINLSRLSLDLQEDGSGIIRLDADQISNCQVVNAAQPVSIGRVGSNALAVRLGPDLVPGLSYVVVAFDTPSGATRIVTLISTFSTASGQPGTRVLNAAGLTSTVDAFLTPAGEPIDTARLASVFRDSVALALDVPARLPSVRLTTQTGDLLLLDLDARPFRASQRLTLVVRAPVAPGGMVSPFVFEGC
jgi:hypothetical protein